MFMIPPECVILPCLQRRQTVPFRDLMAVILKIQAGFAQSGNSVMVEYAWDKVRMARQRYEAAIFFKRKGDGKWRPSEDAKPQFDSGQPVCDIRMRRIRYFADNETGYVRLTEWPPDFAKKTVGYLVPEEIREEFFRRLEEAIEETIPR